MNAQNSKLDITSATVIKPTEGRLVGLSVLVAGAVGAVYDATSTTGNTAANETFVIPAVVGYYKLDGMPHFRGIVIAPGAAQVVSAFFSPMDGAE